MAKVASDIVSRDLQAARMVTVLAPELRPLIPADLAAPYVPPHR
jgi:hypothetical protein